MTKPNIVLIVADDLGYGDLNISPYNGTIDTPNIGALADEGVRLSSFYVPSPVCTPSRAALLTGQYPVEAGMVKVIWPSEPHGIDSSTSTMAEALQDLGYATGIIGKWHLGDEPGNLPTDRGFDYYYGMPYSNDMDKPVLMRNTDVIEEYPNQANLTTNYTDEAKAFISSHTNEPFFLYMPHTDPHVPLYPKAGKKPSGQETYAQVIQDLDESVGDILQHIDSLGLKNNTIIIFTSDNGPALNVAPPNTDMFPWFEEWKSHAGYHDVDAPERWAGGSPGVLQNGKKSLYEGGIRVPLIVRWPAEIPHRETPIDEPAILMDLYPMLVNAAGGNMPNTPYVEDIVDVLRDPVHNSRAGDTFFFYAPKGFLGAVRDGDYKLHLGQGFTPGNLYNVRTDPGESQPINDTNVKNALKALAQGFHQSMVPVTMNDGIYLPDLRNEEGWVSNIHVRNDTPAPRKATIRYYNPGGSVRKTETIELLPYQLAILRVNEQDRIAGTGTAVVYEDEYISVMVDTVSTSNQQRYAYSGVSSPSTKIYLPALYSSQYMNSRIVVQNTEDRSKQVYIHYYRRDTGKYVGHDRRYLHPYESTVVEPSGFGDDGSAFITSYPEGEALKLTAEVVTTWASGRTAAYAGLSGNQRSTKLYAPSVFRLQGHHDEWHLYSGTGLQDTDGTAAVVRGTANYYARTINGTDLPLEFQIPPHEASAYEIDWLGACGLNTRNGGDKPQEAFEPLGGFWVGSLTATANDSQKIAGINTTIWGSANRAGHYEMLSPAQGRSSFILPIVWRWTSEWVGWSSINVVNLDENDSTTVYFTFYNQNGGLMLMLVKEVDPGRSIGLNTRTEGDGWYDPQIIAARLGNSFTGSVQVTAGGGAESIGVNANLITGRDGNGAATYTGFGR